MTWHPGAPLPPPQPLSPAPGRSASRAAILLSWLVIASVVVYTAVSNWRSSHSNRVEHAVDTVELEITSRTMIGYVNSVRSLGVGAQLEQRLPEVIKSITASARTIDQKLMAVPVIGEVQGKDAALARLDELAAEIGNTSDAEADAGHAQDVATLRTIYTKSPDDVSASDRQRLEGRLKWFGKLAMVAGLPDSNPRRQAILYVCRRAAAATFGIEILLFVLLLAGLALMIIAIIKLANRSLRLNYLPAPQTGSQFIEMFALYLLGFVTIGHVARAMHVSSNEAVYGIALIWIVACCFWPVIRGISFAELCKGLGWSTGRGILVEAFCGLVGYLAFMPLLALAMLTTVVLSKLGHEQAIHPIIFELQDHSLRAIIGLYVLASVFAPVVEETMFRGALFHHLRRSHRWLLSAALTGFIFASIHPQGWSAFPMLGTIGFSFAGIREWRGNVIASGTAHAVNNAVATTMLLLVLS